MEKFILASHGSLAYGFQTALEMIIGESENVNSYSLDEYNSPEDIYNIVDEEVQEHPEDQYVVFTDLLGGSVHNSLLCLCKYDNVIVVSGVHLGLLLEIVLNEKTGTLIEKVDQAIKVTNSMIMSFSKDMINSRIGEKERGILCD